MSTKGIVNLDNLQSTEIFPLSDLSGLISRSAGVYTRKMLIEGNAFLSTVFIESIDVGASVEVKYYDFTTGKIVSERFDLTSHSSISSAGSERIVVTRIHNKPICEVTVLNGSARFGVYITAVSYSASDIDNALKFNEQDVSLSLDKALPEALYDPVTNKWYFAQSDKGIQIVKVIDSGETAGTPIFPSFVGITDPGVTQNLISDTVSAGKTRLIRQVIVSCSAYGEYEILADGAIIGSGITSPSNPKDIFPFDPNFPVPSGKTIEVKFRSSANSPITSLKSFLMSNEI